MRPPLVVVSVPLAPMVVLLLPVVPLLPAVVLPLPVVPLPEAVLPLPVVPLPEAVLPLPVVPLPVVVLPELAPAEGVVLLLELGDVVVSLDEGVEPVVDELEPAVPEPEVPLPEVCAIAKPPNAKAAAAARVVRVFLVVVISNSLSGNPEGEWVEKSRPKASCCTAYFSTRAIKSGRLQAQPVGPPLSPFAAQ